MRQCKQQSSLQPPAPLRRRSWVLVGPFFERSRDRLALSKRNQSVRGDPPQHWGQEQAEGGDAEDQQVHLEGKAHELAVISVT